MARWRKLLGALWLLSCSCATQAASPPPGASAAPEPVLADPSIEPSYFGGEVILPARGERPSERLMFFVRFEPDEKDPTQTIAKLTIPVQGVDDVELQIYDHTATGSDVELVKAGARFVWARTGGDFECVLRQGGTELDCELEELDAEEFELLRVPERPQHPKGPFPYRSEELTWQRPADPGRPETAARFAGTLTVPAGEGPHPAVLLITGSGTQDRDETLMWHKPFWVIADDLSRKGVAVLRVDDRGAGESTGAADVDSLDLARDAEVAIAQLRAHPAVDPKRVGILGHSEGGLIGPIVAANDPELAFLVLLAGPGMSGRELLLTQQDAIAQAMDLPDSEIEQSRQLNIAIYDALEQLAPDEDASGIFEPIVDAWIRELPELDRPDATQRKQLLEQLEAQASTRWFRVLLGLDARDYLAKVSCPVLAINGTKDLQVVHPQNLDAIAKVLASNGVQGSETRAFEGLNHLFQRATTGLMDEYGKIKTTIEPEVLAVISAFVRKHAGLDEGRQTGGDGDQAGYR